MLPGAGQQFVAAGLGVGGSSVSPSWVGVSDVRGTWEAQEGGQCTMAEAVASVEPEVQIYQ